MKLAALLFFVSLSVFAEQPQILPNPEAFTGWSEVQDYVTSHIDLSRLTQVKVNCAADSNHLYPTHPQQDSKLYHRFNWGSYDHSKLIGDSEACAMASPHKDKKAKFSCLRPDVVYDVIISDIYQDKCGQLYRGFWQIIYLKANENMGTLFSRGRTLYPNPKSNFDNDYVVGQTYEVATSEFLFFSPILNGDRDQALQLKSRALSTTHTFDTKTLLFNPR